jgi:IMP and pyridine-specific 5'-nucleotidase
MNTVASLFESTNITLLHRSIFQQIFTDMSITLPDSTAISSRRRNYMLNSHRKDQLIEWMKGMLSHSFVLNLTATYLDTMSYFEDLIEEYRSDPLKSRLKQYVPSVSVFHTSLPLRIAFQKYDMKYNISKRKHIQPSFNEIRHVLNLAQVMAIGRNLSLITFDGDQTLYEDGESFKEQEELSSGIAQLLIHNVRVCVVTAAGYGLDASQYERRLQGLLDSFIHYGLSSEQIERFFVCGGECNYLFQSKCESNRVFLRTVPYEEWQAEELGGPRPYYWPQEQIQQVLDVAEKVLRSTAQDLNLRAKVLRKERAVGIYPGGKEMVAQVPIGHGSNKLKREALDEIVLRTMDALRTTDPPISIPYCVFNGGRDAWLDIGNKSVAVAALQAYFKLEPSTCLHVGDQFLTTGNDIAARATSPCIWIISPKETEKILQHVIQYKGLERMSRTPSFVELQSTAGLSAALEDGKFFFSPYRENLEGGVESEDD